MQISNVLLDCPFPKERVFRYQAMQDILYHLANNPFEEFTQQELASMTGADVSSISRSVELLEKLDVIAVSEQRPTRITIDSDHLQRPDPVFMTPQSEFRKPVQAYLDELKTRIQASEDVISKRNRSMATDTSSRYSSRRRTPPSPTEKTCKRFSTRGS
jgi:hypothetical protein